MVYIFVLYFYTIFELALSVRVYVELSVQPSYFRHFQIIATDNSVKPTIFLPNHSKLVVN